MSKGKSAKGTAIKQIEMRRCVVCRQVRHKSELIRVVKSDGKITVDESGKAQGRGAYLCKSPECMTIINRRRSLEKIFKVKISDEVYDALRDKIPNHGE
ncbi:MAG: YlxR family protein [Selenomonadaceae bacterium]|nr:YlxR family protein [Selenomonadaceae bacterium]